MLTDLAVFLFVAVLVLGGIFVPRVGDAIGRLLRRDAARDGRPPRSSDGPPGGAARSPPP